jgi:formylglycine-generating enzyme
MTYEKANTIPPGWLAVHRDLSPRCQTNNPVIFPDEDALTPENLKLVWPSTPGIRYEVKQSTNLQSWSTAPGYPATANGPAQQMPFLSVGNARFFQVRELDEQPPVIVSQYPQNGGFAVPRFADLTIQLSDVTGINSNSIRLTVGSLGTFTLTNAQLTFSNGVLTFINGGSIPLGDWGTNAQAMLVAADTLGNAGTNTWSFTLEIQPQVVTNLFVFGSPQAQRTGQRIGNIPTAALAARFGPIPMGDGDPWTLEQVLSNSLVVSYTNTPPGIAADTYVCNLTPRTTDEIFYRKVTSASNNPAAKLLTLFTTNVPLAEILKEGSVSLSSESVIYDVDTNNVIIRALSYDDTLSLPELGTDKSGTTVYDQGGVTLRFVEARWLFSPSLRLSFETSGLSLQRLDAEFHGALRTALVPELTVVSSDLNATRSFDLFSKSKTIWFSAGGVPIWLNLKFTLEAEIGYDLDATGTMSTGVRQNVDVTFGVDYVRNRSPKLQWNPSVTRYPLEIVPFTYQINGAASAYATLTPQIEMRVYSVAGVSANVDPTVEITGSATVNNGQLTSANWSLVADANLNIGMTVIGLDNEDLPALPPFNLFRKEWSSVYPPPGQLSIRTQPQSREVVVGSAASFSVDAVSDQPIGYQWYFNDVPLPGKTGSSLSINSVTLGHAGQYCVRLESAGQTLNSSTATLSVRTASTPSGMVLIPAGSFTMGDTFSEGNSAELPLHTVYVSAFFMDRNEVTKALWDDVYQWATNHGYSFDNAGLGKAANHPVHTINWYDAVKWCNARSEKDGRVPAYFTSAAQTTVYRTGQTNVQNEWVKWDRGYRLPTEAEWEKAARGGASGHRFPWGNTISWSQANYYTYLSGSYPYDVNSASGYHPTFNDAVYPYTSPVGYFAPNGYGLYDMTGNVWECCWDWYSGTYYSSSPTTDPRGPSGALSARVLRGGSWEFDAYFARCAFRIGLILLRADDYIGFRCVRGTPSATADTIGPSLTISNPTNGSSVPDIAVAVSGTASDLGRGNSGITSVTVNGVRADNDTATGSGAANWSRIVPLSPGVNTITVVATDGDNNITTSSITVTNNPPGIVGMVYVAGGTFTMGDALNDGYPDERPLHSVYVSGFYVDPTEVTKALWDEVYNWAITHGYAFDNPGSWYSGAEYSKGTNHPVHTVNWFDCVKWCNARSEKEGRTRAYYLDAGLTQVYKAGQVAPYVNWNAGYRLPTEAEWEKAARGGLTGKRFPWGDTITHSDANYYSSASYSYDISPTRGFNPAYYTGLFDYPYTSPVVSFAPNGYGCYDVAGNVKEWCWDWYDDTWYAKAGATLSDTRGPTSSPYGYRVLRDGLWWSSARDLRCANRNYVNTALPTDAGDMDVGFRCALPPGQP